jgi:hypothetical protein
MNANKTVLHQMAIDAWSAGASLLVVCLALEAAERGFVSRFFNLLWLLTFTLVATILVMATHPGAPAGEGPRHRYAQSTRALLQVGSIAAAAAAWLLLPRGLSVVWRSLASGGILLAALLAWPALSKNE